MMNDILVSPFAVNIRVESQHVPGIFGTIVRMGENSMYPQVLVRWDDQSRLEWISRDDVDIRA